MHHCMNTGNGNGGALNRASSPNDEQGRCKQLNVTESIFVFVIVSGHGGHALFRKWKLRDQEGILDITTPDIIGPGHCPRAPASMSLARWGGNMTGSPTAGLSLHPPYC